MKPRTPKTEQTGPNEVGGWHRYLKNRRRRILRRHFRRLMKLRREDEIHETQERRYYGYES